MANSGKGCLTLADIFLEYDTAEHNTKDFSRGKRKNIYSERRTYLSSTRTETRPGWKISAESVSSWTKMQFHVEFLFGFGLLKDGKTCRDGTFQSREKPRTQISA